MDSCLLTAQNDKYECPRWDSNPHLTDFKSAASADWATRAIGTDYFQVEISLRAEPNTESNILSVSLPVKVFCWLGW